MINSIKLFFDKLFFYGYWRLRNKESNPEIMPILFISICQSNNILTLFNLVLLILDTKIPYQFIIVAFFIVVGLNFYWYIIKRKKENIILDSNLRDKYMLFKSIFYLIISSFLFAYTLDVNLNN